MKSLECRVMSKLQISFILNLFPPPLSFLLLSSPLGLWRGEKQGRFTWLVLWWCDLVLSGLRGPIPSFLSLCVPGEGWQFLAILPLATSKLLPGRQAMCLLWQATLECACRSWASCGPAAPFGLLTFSGSPALGIPNNPRPAASGGSEPAGRNLHLWPALESSFLMQ